MVSLTARIGLVAFAALGVYSSPALVVSSALSTCQAIQGAVSKSSSVLYPDALNFTSDIEHWFLSSTQTPTCVLQAGSPQDVASAMKLIARKKTPFAIKSGGHASNPGFSSTTGVHIVSEMQQVTLSPDLSTVEIGMGQVWTGVYSALQGSGVNVVGGRTQGPGVGGFTLGGGFSWKTNQFGLTCDTVKAYNVVFPNGTIGQVNSSNPDLFFAMKGGLNRFGVVTSVVYYTHPQVPTVYGGFAVYASSEIEQVLNATHTFYTQNTDSRAQIITTIEGGATGSTGLVLFFYDGPTRPASFAAFDNITPLISTIQAQTFSSFVGSIPAKLQLNDRGTFNSISTSQLTPTFLAAVLNETEYWASQMAAHGGATVSYDVEPFLASYGSFATDSAYPHADSPLPLNLYFAWVGAANDAYWYNAMKASTSHLRSVAVAEGIMPADYTVYPNYAISNTSSKVLFGARNAARLAKIRKQVDPHGVMELAGGFAI